MVQTFFFLTPQKPTCIVNTSCCDAHMKKDLKNDNTWTQKNDHEINFGVFFTHDQKRQKIISIIFHKHRQHILAHRLGKFST
jgi:hypothetical protein